MSILTADAPTVVAKAETEKLDRLYPNSAASNLKVDLPTAWSPQQQDAARTAIRGELGYQSKLALGPEQSQTLADLLSATHSEESRANWRSESDKKLRDLAVEFGVPTDELLRNAAAWLARGQTVRKLISDGGLGDNPQLVDIAVRKARELKSRGWM